MFTQITGCATTMGLTPAEPEILNDPNRARLFVPSRDQIVTNARNPSVKGWRHFIYNVNGTIEWFNGYQENFNRTGPFYEREQQYVLLAVELNPGRES